MKEIKIVSRWNKNKILICGKYKSIKDCLEKNRDADLGGADLRDADLGDADLGGAYLRDAYLRDADLGGADLGGADLRDADLGDADLRGADLGGADLGGADLGGAKNYYNSHDFALELIRRQPIRTFTDKEWITIGQIAIHRFCWTTLRKKYKRTLFFIYRKLAKTGFGEYLEYIREGK